MRHLVCGHHGHRAGGASAATVRRPPAAVTLKVSLGNRAVAFRVHGSCGFLQGPVPHVEERLSAAQTEGQVQMVNSSMSHAIPHATDIQMCVSVCRSAHFYNFVKSMLVRNPKKRPGASKMLSVSSRRRRHCGFSSFVVKRGE